MSDHGTSVGVPRSTHALAERADEAREVLSWRRRGDVWEGLVSRDVDGELLVEWLPALVLRPLDVS